MKFKTQTPVICVLMLIALFSTLRVNAATITLSPTSPILNVNNGDTINLDILMDFTGDPTLGGGFDIVFDGAALLLLSFNRNPVGNPALARDPDILPGLLSGWALADFFGLPEIANLGSVSFQVLSAMGASSVVELRATSSIAGPFVSAIDFSVSDPTFNTVSITRATSTSVPETTTIMLLGAGMLLAGWKGNRDKREP